MTSRDHAANGSSRWKVVACALLAIAAFVLFFTEQRAQALGVLPYLILLLCPLMHFLTHGGGHRGHGPRRDDQGGEP